MKQQTKKLTAAVLSVACALSSLGVIPCAATKPMDKIYFYSTFEKGTDGWTGRGMVFPVLSDAAASLGTHSLLVTGRTEAWNGAALSLNTTNFKPGKYYVFSADVCYLDGSPTDTFRLMLQYEDGTGITKYDLIAECIAAKGEWTRLYQPHYTIPAGATEMQIYVETSESTVDFFIDEVVGATLDASVDSVVKGDINEDGLVDVFDLTIGKRYLLDSQFSLAGDVDENGSFELSDLIQLQKFIHAQIKKFTVVEQPTEPVPTEPAPTEPVPTEPVPTESVPTEPTPTEPNVSYMASIQDTMTASVPDSATQVVPGRDYGTVIPISYYSTIATKEKGANVLLPANYSEDKQYPVLYVNHGIFGDQNSMLDEGMKVRTIAGNLTASGEAEEMIIVFTFMYTSENTENCQGFTVEETQKYDAFREDLTQCLMPYINEHYSVKTGRENTGISGFSMGGRETLYIGITKPEYFGYIGAVCPAPGVTPGVDGFMAHPGNMQESELKISDPANQPYMLLLAGGTNDGVVGTFPQKYNEILTANGQEHLWIEVPGGGHDGSTVAPMFYNLLRHIFKG